MLRVVVLAIFGALASWAQPAELSTSAIRRLEHALEAERVAQKVVGMSVSVAHRGSIRYSNGFGLADLENSLPARPDTVYRLGSISKTISAVAALQLYEHGRLDLDAPIQKYVPSFPKKPWPISTRQLLGHLGGIRSYKGDEMQSTHHFSSVTDGVKIFAGEALEHEPGTKYLYTTHGFSLVGAAIEAVAGQRFIDYINANIFNPAGMDHAREDSVYSIIHNRTRGYMQNKDGAIVNAGLADTSYKIPGGGFVAAADDIVRFGMALERGSLIKPQTFKLMVTSQQTSDGKETGYGMGISLSLYAGKRAYTHSGSQQGCRTVFAIFPDEHYVIAILTNSEHADYRKLIETAVRVLMP